MRSRHPVFRAAVNPSLDAAGKTSCFARPGTQSCDSVYLPMTGVRESLLALHHFTSVSLARRSCRYVSAPWVRFAVVR